MSFITSIQASVQGCKTDTPHSEDIRRICGGAQCAKDEPTASFGKWILETVGAWMTELGGYWKTEG